MFDGGTGVIRCFKIVSVCDSFNCIPTWNFDFVSFLNKNRFVI